MRIFDARNETVWWGNDIQFFSTPLLDNFLELALSQNWSVQRGDESEFIIIKMPVAEVAHETFKGTLWFKEGSWKMLTMHFDTLALFSALESKCEDGRLPAMCMVQKAYHEAVLNRDLGNPKRSEMITAYGEPTQYWSAIYEFGWCQIRSCMTWPNEGYIRVMPRE